MGWSRTSFYIKAREAALSGLKVSLHGEDARHPGKAGFKLAEDVSAVAKSEEAGGRLIASPGMLPLWFPGANAVSGSTHVLRFRVPWDLLQPPIPSAPAPAPVRARAFAGIVRAPLPLHSVDVDVFVSRKRPYWPNEKRARADKACIGPLQNESGDYLTAVAVHRLILASPT